MNNTFYLESMESAEGEFIKVSKPIPLKIYFMNVEIKKYSIFLEIEFQIENIYFLFSKLYIDKCIYKCLHIYTYILKYIYIYISKYMHNFDI